MVFSSAKEKTGSSRQTKQGTDVSLLGGKLILPVQVLSDLVSSLLESIIYLLAAEIFLSYQVKDIKRLMPKVFIFGLIGGILATATFQLLEIFNLNHLRIILNLILILLLIKIIFEKSWWNAIKATIFFTFFGIFSQTITIFLLIYVYKLSISQVMSDDLSMLFKIKLPIDLLTLIIAILLRKFRIKVINFLANIKVYNNSPLITSVFIAILLQIALLVSLMADYINNLTFKESPLRLSIIIAINVSIVLISLFILLKSIRKTEEKIVAASSSAISENIYSLLNSVRSQRHDFINHVQIINSLFHTHDKEGLTAYLSHLTNDITVLNNVLKVDNPFIGALLNSKIDKAGLKGIDLQVDINAKLSNLSTKAFDLTRILDNLISNAIEDIEQHNKSEKWIKVTIKEQGPFLSITVTNPGSPSVECAERIFEPGYTTKNGEHSGLGLHICKQLGRKLHGKLEYTIVPGLETSFSLKIPKP